MGVDSRVGIKDYHTRYRLYDYNVDKDDESSIDKNFLGVLHCKDVTSYIKQGEVFANKFQFDNVRATLETLDKMDIKVDYLLYAVAENQWYRIVSVDIRSINKSQRFSSRPINVTRIGIVRSD